MNPKCYCGNELIFEANRYGGMYRCSEFPRCEGRVGAGPDGKPLGTATDEEGRALRIAAHAKFDLLWKTAEMTRKEAYKWLQDALRLSKAEAHIAMMGKSKCRELIELLDRRGSPPAEASSVVAKSATAQKERE